MKIVTDDRVYDYVAERLGNKPLPPYRCLGVEESGVIIGGVVFNNFSPHDVELTVAGESRAWTRTFFRRVRDYVFDECGYLRLTFTTEHQDVVELACRLGGQTEGRKRNHFGLGRDAILLGVLKDEWALT